MSTKLGGAGFTLDDDGLAQLAMFARRDDCLDAFVPSDIRQMAGELQRLRAALKPFSDIADLVRNTDVRDGECVYRLRNPEGGYFTLQRKDFRNARATLTAGK